MFRETFLTVVLVNTTEKTNFMDWSPQITKVISPLSFFATFL